MAQPQLQAVFFVAPDGVVVPKDGPVSTRLRLAVLKRDGYVCQRCGHKVTKFRRREFFGDPVGAVDHITARARGGRTSIENLRTLCEPCNASKGGKSDAEYDAYLARIGQH